MKKHEDKLGVGDFRIYLISRWTKAVRIEASLACLPAYLLSESASSILSSKVGRKRKRAGPWGEEPVRRGSEALETFLACEFSQRE